MLFLFADGYVIGHYANNARDFLYPAVPPYPGSGREVTLFKTSLFNPIRITVSTAFMYLISDWICKLHGYHHAQCAFNTYTYICQLFLSHRHESFIPRSPRIFTDHRNIWSIHLPSPLPLFLSLFFLWSHPKVLDDFSRISKDVFKLFLSWPQDWAC